MEEMQLFQSSDFSIFAPRVAPCPAFAALRRDKSQPWAECFNPFGIADTNNASPYSAGIPLKTSRTRVCGIGALVRRRTKPKVGPADRGRRPKRQVARTLRTAGKPRPTQSPTRLILQEWKAYYDDLSGCKCAHAVSSLARFQSSASAASLNSAVSLMTGSSSRIVTRARRGESTCTGSNSRTPPPGSMIASTVFILIDRVRQRQPINKSVRRDAERGGRDDRAPKARLRRVCLTPFVRRVRWYL